MKKLYLVFALFFFFNGLQAQTNHYKSKKGAEIKSGQREISNVISVAQNILSSIYTGPTYPFDCTDGDVIKNVTFGSINNNSECGNTSNGYSDYSTSVAPAQVRAGTTLSISVTVGDGWEHETVGIWIDYNQDGILDDSEFTYVGSGLDEEITALVLVPLSAKLGTTRMRVVLWAVDPYSNEFSYFLERVNGPPFGYYGPYGEMEDYSITILSPFTPDASNILYVNQEVDDSDPDYTGAGDSWANAIPELANALQWAQANREQGLWNADNPLKIYVAKGTYIPSIDPSTNELPIAGQERDATFLLVKNVQLYGGFDPDNGISNLNHQRVIPSVDEGSPTGGTILSGDLDNNDSPDGTINGANTFHVVLSAGNVEKALLDGFTITGGNAKGVVSNIIVNGQITKISRFYGGGMYNVSSSPVLTNVTISGNTAMRGGGMYNISSAPVLTNVTISGNTTDSEGGGMYNSASSPVLTDVTISGNATESSGGGMYNFSSSSSIILTNVTISGNTAANSAGGMYNDSSSPVLTNVTISGNTVANSGGGMVNNSYSFPKLFNSIVWGNGAGPSMAGNAINPASDHNLIDGGSESHVIGDVFVDHVQATAGNPSTGGDFSLAVGSPAINAGSNTHYTDPDKGNGDLANDLDLADNPRLQGATIDLGAYESSYEDLVSLSASDAVSVDYGTQLADIPLPTDFTATLTNGDEVPIDLDADTANWVLVSTSPVSYDPNVAGTYTFEVPVLLPDPTEAPWFTNAQDLIATLEITVEKGISNVEVSWKGDVIGTLMRSRTIVLDLIYGDEGPFSTNYLDYRLTRSFFGFVSGPHVLDLWRARDYTYTVDVGDSQLRFDFEENDNFKEGIFFINVRVAPKDLTFDDLVVEKSKAYDGLSIAQVLGGRLVGVINEDDVSVVPTAVYDDENVGDNKKITVSYALTGADARKYNAPADVEILGGVITKVDLQVQAKDVSKVYGELDPAFQVEYSGFVGNEDVSEVQGVISYTREIGEDVRSYRIAPSGLNAQNYNILYQDGELEITQLPVTVTADGGTKVYGTSDPVFTFVSSPTVGTTLPNGEFIFFTGELIRDPGEDVGVYSIDQGALANPNYTIAFTGSQFEITEATMTGLSLADKTVIYDGDRHSLSVIGLPDDATVIYQNNDQTEAGDYTVTARVSKANYQDWEESAILTINKAEAIITAEAMQSHVYDGTVKNVVATLNHGESELTYSPQKGYTDVGTYLITVSAAESNNYKAVSLDVTLAITPALMTGLSLADKTVTYNVQKHGLSVSGLPDGAMVTYQNNDQTEAGDYTVTAKVSKANYQDWEDSATLTINKAEAVIAADAVQNHVYDGTVKDVVASLNHNETALNYGPQKGYTNADIYTITVSANESTNYKATSKLVQLLINQADFSGLIFNDQTFTYNTKPQSLVLEGAPAGSAIEYTGNDQTDAGRYSVTAKVTHPNYKELTQSATLTINKAQQKISFEEIGTVTRDANRVPLTVNSNSGLSVTVSGNDNLVATIAGSDLLIHRLGAVRLTATQEGDKNHEAATPVTIIVQVADEADGPVKVHKALSPNGDGINDFLIIEGVKDYPENKLSVFSRNGLKIFEMSGYDNDSKVFRGVGNISVRNGTLPEGTYFYTLEYKDNGKWKTKKGWFVMKK